MPENLSIGRQAGAVESPSEPRMNPGRRAVAGKPEARAVRADQVDLSAPRQILTADFARLGALEAELEGRRYFVAAEVLSRRLIEEHLAAEACCRHPLAR